MYINHKNSNDDNIIILTMIVIKKINVEKYIYMYSIVTALHLAAE